MRTSNTVIIGIDPGIALTGYGVIKSNRTTNQLTVLEYGVIRTLAHTPLCERLVILYKDLNELLQRYHPTHAGCEKLFFSNNAKTAMDVGQARGTILLALAQHHIAVVELTPPQVKQSVTGYGSAKKQQVQLMTQQILKLIDFPKQDDAADALAIAIAAQSILRT